MKIALYIEDGREQIVLSPQTPTEAQILSKLYDNKPSLSVYRGSFYSCQGGWTRWALSGGMTDLEDKSLILVLDHTPKQESA